MIINLPPAGFCAHCNVPLKAVRSGVMLNGLLADGRSYYKVAADVHGCPVCGREVYHGFGEPISYRTPDYDKVATDVDIRLEPPR